MNSENKRKPIRFDRVMNVDQLEETKRFAESFKHTINDHTIHPIVRFFRGKKLLGYATFVRHPVCFANFHTDPEVCSPRDFMEVTEQLRAWACLNTIEGQFPNGVFFVGLHTDYPEHMKEAMEHMGFRDTKHTIWQFA